MKPSFALNLTSDSIGLLQRTEGGWQDIGSVPFDSPDLPAALGTLRGKAGPGLTSKIVLPDSQILYTEVVAPGPDTGARRTQIRAALEGLTPYAVRELVFDWHGSGDRVKVAVIARETLQEAEAFAEEHGFNPLSFVAAPSPEKFGKEPWFGTTAGAQKRLPKGEKVERDLEALVLAGAAPEEDAALPEAAEPLAHPVPEIVEPEIPGSELPEAVAEELPPSEAEAAPESAEPLAHPLPETVEPEIPGSELPEEPELEAEAPEGAEHDDAPEAVEPVTEAEAPQPETPEVIAERFTDVILPAEAEPVAPEEMSEPEAAPEDEPEDAPLPATPEFVPPPFRRAPERPIPHARDLPPFAPPVTPPVFPAGPAKPAARPQVGVADSEIPEAPFVEVAEEPAAGAPATFASRRGLEGAAAPLGPAPGFAAKARSGKPGETDRIPPRPVGLKTAGAAPAPAAQRAAGLSVTAPSLPGARGRKPAAKPAPQPAIPPRPAATATPAGPSSIDSLGSFTGRQLPKRGKPKHLGLILTGLLLLVLAAIAAWASFADFSDEATAATEVSDAAGAVEPGVEDEMLADLQDPAELAPGADAALAGAEAALPAPEADAAAAPEAEAIAEPEPVQAEAAAVEAPTPAAEAPEVAETAAAPPAAAGDAAQDEIFLTAMDAPQPTLDAAALPDPPVAPDAAPGAQMPPPPFGTVYDFDAEGLIVPTAEGIVAPGGFTLVAGAPAVKPPSRPASAAPAETAPAAATPAAAPSGALGSLVPTAPVAGETAAETVADPALAGARPRARPAELTPPAATPEQETALPEAAAEAIAEAVAEATTDASSPRPRARPAGAVEAAPAAQDATLMMASAPAPRPDTPEVAAAADGSISPLAIAVSRKPVARPSDFSGAIEAAVAAAVRQPTAPAAAAIARVEPEEQDEPEVQPVVAPRIPTRANVAQQATFANAINLREINLIGVYGTSSNRYALVRQSNGKYRRVSVGDRLDGGTVAAITASELRYRKGSRMLALQMPRG